MKIRYALFFVAIVFAAACGNVATDSVMTGQVKKVQHNTPLICPDYVDVDVSLGVLKNGVGSMSTQDVWITVPAADTLAVLTSAASSGMLVDITYDQRRVVICTDDYVAKAAKVER